MPFHERSFAELVVAHTFELQACRIGIGEPVAGGAEDRDLVLHARALHLIVDVVDVASCA